MQRTARLGFNTPRLGRLQVGTLLMRLRLAAIAVEKEWMMFDERDLKKLLLWVDDRFSLPDGEWPLHSYRIAVRKFVKILI
ncbi:MAG TPA: hypothetical protein HA257_03660 [Candidatus Methanoperedenaceae archaeon]|nr:hypothetical protein [Candidatus Methanoperedenaceae archaeon]